MMRRIVRQSLNRHPRMDGVFRRVIWSRVHFPEVELRVIAALRNGSFDCAVDVGAALGSYAFVLMRKARHVVAYEPGSANGDYLAVATRGTNISLVRAAVGAEPGELDLFTGPRSEDAFTATLSRANPIVQTAGVVGRRVPVISLDDDLARRVSRDARIDLVKIDVEGFENAVIAGAAATIERHKPVIVCEIEARHNAQYSMAFDTLRTAGYRVYFRRRGAWIVLSDNAIERMQRADDFDLRTKVGGSDRDNFYINNFIFQHPASRVSIIKNSDLARP